MTPPKHILIVDDDPLNCELLEGLMEALGHTSQIAQSGPEALEKLSPAFDLVLLDAMMPGMDGFEVARQIRARPAMAQLPIVMVTALDGKEDRLKAVEAGANDFITKPIDRTELRVRIASLLKMKEAGDAILRHQEELRARNAAMQADLDLARAMQQAFFLKKYPTFPPNSPPEESALAFCHRYLPTTTLGGDFFDVMALSDTRAGIFICDVMGHGVRSALVTAMMRALVSERTSVAADPAKFLGAINHHLLGILEQAGTPLFASAFYGIADTQTGELRFANAGHPSPIHVQRAAHKVDWLFHCEDDCGPVLGVFEDADYHTQTVPLASGDQIFLFTDGIFEVTGPREQFGEERLLAAVKKRRHLPPDALFDELLDEVRAYSITGEFEDDVCLLAIEVA